MNPRVHCISYFNDRFEKSSARLRSEASEFKEFLNFKLLQSKNLPESFRKEFKKILNKKKGAGFWIWKPFIIKHQLDLIKNGEYLLYLDAGCTINKKGKGRYFEYLNMLNSSDIGCISFKFNNSWRPEKHWTTNEIFKYFGVKDASIKNTGQFISTIHILQKKEHSVFLVDKWIQTLYDDRELFTDHYANNQKLFFKKNRHDQSVFSVLRKIHGSLVLSDESKFLNNTESMLDDGKKYKYPFWATKIKDY
jgi:hypothetical protein